MVCNRALNGAYKKEKHQNLIKKLCIFRLIRLFRITAQKRINAENGRDMARIKSVKH